MKGHYLRLIALVAVHAKVTVALAVVMASAPLLMSDFHLSQTEYGLLVSTFYVGQIALAIPSGRIVDRIGARRGLSVSALFAVTGLCLLALASNVDSAFAVMLFLGASASFVNPATAKVVCEAIPGNYRTFAMSVKQMGVPIGALLGAAAAFFALGHGRQQVFFALAVVIAMTSLVLLTFPRDAIKAKLHAPVRFLALLRNRHLIEVSVCNGLFNVAQVGLWSSVASFGATVGGGPKAGVACFALLQGASVLGRFGLGLAANILGPDRVVHVVLTAGCIGGLALVALALCNDAITVYALLFLLGLTVGGYPGLLQSMALTTVPPQSLAAAVGINMVLVLIGATVGPVLIGAVVDAGGGFSLAFLALSAFVLMACAYLARVDRQSRRSARA